MSKVDEYFEGKPETHRLFRLIEERIEGLGPAELTVKSQISFAVNRQFAWFWLYNVTRKNPSGILHVMLALDRDTGDSHARNISRVGKNRWNHQIVIRTVEEAESEWLGDLIAAAYRYGSR